MGAFLTIDKNGYYWSLLSYLADENIYVTDPSLLPFTPSKLQTYVDFYPQFYNAVLPQRISFEINGRAAGYAIITDPSGLVYFDFSVPKGKFSFVTKDPSGRLLKNETFNAKNYAMFLGVMAQSYDERRTNIEENRADQRFQQMRTGRLYAILGADFNFPPPPGWPTSKYRAAILGGCGPGFISSFFYGTTKKGVVDTIKSITCQDPDVTQPKGGVRWVVRSRANSNPADPGTKGFFITTKANLARVFVPPHYRAMLSGQNWWANASGIVINGSMRNVNGDEQVLKKTNSFIQAKLPAPFDLQAKTLQFSIEEIGVSTSTYNVTFPLPCVNAFQAASAIVAQNPTLTDAVHGTADGFLRIGVYPEAGKVFRITIKSGTAMADLGWKAGDAADVAPDQLANPFVVGPVSLIQNSISYVDGVAFVSSPETGEIVWFPSTAVNIGVPDAGTSLDATYAYQMRREITKMVDLVKGVNDIILYDWE